MGNVSFTHALAAGAGGFVGTVLRYVTGVALARTAERAGFPIATLAVNVAGCFMIGLVGGWFAARPSAPLELRLFLIVGVLGGFTTYSTFANDTFLLARYGHPATAILNVAVHVIAGLCAAWVGYALVRT